MRIVRGLMIVASIATLGACNFSKFDEVDALREVQPVGSPFTQKLTAEYKSFLDSEMGQSDNADSLHFARKGLAAARGDLVMPEQIDDWNIPSANLDELTTARSRLVTMFDLGAREAYPDVSAVAQSRFDCWVEQQEENFQPDDINACKKEFMEALSKLDAQMPNVPPAAPGNIAGNNPLNSVDPNAPMAIENAKYLVFFDWDQYSLNPGAMSVLDAVATEAKKRSLTSITIVGHADTSGTEEYNDKLSIRRANAVRDALAQRGIAANLLLTEARGEKEQLVATPDNVREPANRRAEITFQ